MYRPRASFDRVYQALDAQGRRPRLRNTHIQALCPAHDNERSPALSVDWSDQHGGMTLLKCHSCNASEEDILAALGLTLSDRFDEPPRRPDRDETNPRPARTARSSNRLGPLPKRLTTPAAPPEPQHGRWDLTRAYDYVDETGEVLGQAVRYERLEDGVRVKRFAQRHPDGHGGWVDQAPRRLVLRHLPSVLEAIAADLPVWVVEGEKDDETLNTLLRGPGAVTGIATTNAAGAGAFTSEHAQLLGGAKVTSFVDRDLAGYRRALELSNLLDGVASSYRAVLPAVTEAKADATDHVDAGHTLADVVELAVEHARTLVLSGELGAAGDKAERAAKQAILALDETLARLERSRDASNRSAVKAGADEQRYAVRWAHEAVRHVKAATDAAQLARELDEQLQARIAEHGQPPAQLLGRDAVDRAVEAVDRSQRVAGQAWDACGVPVPPAVREVIARAVPQPEVDHDPESGPQEPYDDDDTVVPFRGHPGGGNGGNGGGGGGGGGVVFIAPEIRWTEYIRTTGGSIVERRHDRNGGIQLHGILNLDARVVRVEYIENEVDEERAMEGQAPDEQKVHGYIVGYTHPDNGEQMTLRVPADRARSGDWLADLPAMGLLYDSSSKGRAKVWDAIRSTSADAEVVTIYRSTGWRQLDEGWVYVHAGGGITATGNVPLPVQLPGTLTRVDLPAPLTDPARLRELFDNHSRAMMRRLLPHVGAVLAGTAYRAPLGWTGPATMLFGTPGSYKSAAAALTMHHFGTRWDRTLPAASMSGQGATLNAIREELHGAKDCLYFGDDFAPDKSIDAAAQFLAQVARMQANREKRDRYDARADTVRLGRATRCTLMLTSEVKAASASGQERLNVIDLAKGDLDLSNIIELDSDESRRGRATVMASMLSWMAADLPALREWARGRVGLIATRRRDGGQADRVAEPLAELQVGWELMTKFLVGVGAYEHDEALEMLREVEAALTDAGERAIDPDSPNSVGERCRQLIVSALRSGTIHLTGVGGLPPNSPEALRFGYRRVLLDPLENLWRYDPRGDWAGVYTSSIHGQRLHVDPTAMISAILATARRANEPLQAGRSVIQRELAVHGLLRTEQAGPGRTRYTCVVPDPDGTGGQTRMWDIDADRLFGLPEDDLDGGPRPVVGPDLYPSANRADQDPTPEPAADEPDPAGTHDQAAEPVDSEESDVKVNAAGQFDTVHLDTFQPCISCGEPCEFAFDGVFLHPSCEIPDTQVIEQPASTVDAAPVDQTPAAPAPANSEPLPSEPIPDRQPRGRNPRQRPQWAYSAVVVDRDAIYLPNGTVVAQSEEIRSVADLGAIGDRLGIGHVAGAGLVVVTSALVEHLGLVPDMQALEAPRADGEPATDDDFASRILAFLADQPAFLSNDEGWSVDNDKMAPWFRIRRENRALRVVLEPYVWVWDRKGEESASPFVELPDVDQDPVECWLELARRLERIAELIGLPWSISPALTGESLFDQVQRIRKNKGGTVLDKAGSMPEMTPTGQARLEAEFVYTRKPRKAEVEAASYLQKYDRRGSYLANIGGVDLGHGDPTHIDGSQASEIVGSARQAKSKLPYGTWLVTLPAWDQPMPPPHPAQTLHQPIQQWVTTSTLVLLLDDEDAGGAGYSVEDLAIAEAWIWPQQARLLEPWYRHVRDAFLTARADKDHAVAKAIKGIYTGYVGRLASQWSARGTRPWHHQPVWEATIRAAARASLWRVLQRHHRATGRLPVGIDRDEVGYLDDERNPKAHPPAADNGRLGALKSSGTIELTAELKASFVSGSRAPLDKSLPVLPLEDEG